MNDLLSRHQPGFSLLGTYPVTLGDSSHGLRKDGTQHKARGSEPVFPPATKHGLSERSDTVNCASSTPGEETWEESSQQPHSCSP